MYKIEKIRVNNFKNIIDTDLELDSMNVIVGPNNSGKSNFLQVIPFLKHIIRDDLEVIKDEFEEIIDLFDYLPYHKTLETKARLQTYFMEFHLEFINIETQIKGVYEIELKIEDILWNKGMKYQISIYKEGLWYKNINSTGPLNRVFERGENSLFFGSKINLTNKDTALQAHASVLRLVTLMYFLDNPKEVVLDVVDVLNGLNEILNSSIFYFSSFELRKSRDENPKSYQNKRTIWVDLNKEIKKLLDDEVKGKNLRDAFRNIIGITDINSSEFYPKGLNPERRSIFMHNNQRKIFTYLSDGSLLLAAFIVQVLSTKNDIIFIEEPENSIHPKALEELIKFMKEFEDKKQFIITTHSSTLLNIIKDPGNIIIADVNEEGYSTLRKPKDIKALRKKLSKGFLSLGDLLYFNIDGDIEDKEDAVTY